MDKQVFLSHAVHDQEVAEKLRVCLESHQLSCWIAPRDIRPGSSWSNGIVEGIEASRMMVVILSPRSDASEHVKRELELCIARKKPILPFVIEKFKLSPSMEYCLSHCQWLDATSSPITLHFGPLVQAVQRLLMTPNPSRVPDSSGLPSGQTLPRMKRLGVAGLALLIVGLGIAVVAPWLAPGKTRSPIDPGASESVRPNQGASPAPTDEKSLAILSKLEERISMNFPNDTPLEDIKKYIEASTQDDAAGLPTGIPIYVDPQGLQDVDKTMASMVTINLEGLPLRVSLQLMLDQLGLTYVVRDGFLKIIARETSP